MNIYKNVLCMREIYIHACVGACHVRILFEGLRIHVNQQDVCTPHTHTQELQPGTSSQGSTLPGGNPMLVVELLVRETTHDMGFCTVEKSMNRLYYDVCTFGEGVHCAYIRIDYIVCVEPFGSMNKSKSFSLLPQVQGVDNSQYYIPTILGFRMCCNGSCTVRTHDAAENSTEV